MAVNLHGLRWKIAAAALVKSSIRRIGRIPAAVPAIEAAAGRLEPVGEEATGSYRGLAAQLLRQALPTETGDDVVYDPVAGLVRGTATEQSTLETLVERADENPSAGNLLAVAAAYRKPYIADFSTSAEYYQRAFEANPQDLRAIEGMLTAGTRSHFDWPRIWTLAQTLKPRHGRLRDTSSFWAAVDGLFAQDPDQETIRGARAQLLYHSTRLHTLHQLLLETIAARLQFLGHLHDGTQLRQAIARNRIHELRGIPLESSLWLKHLLGAYVYLGDTTRLAATAQKPPLDDDDELTRLQVQKLQADVALWNGDSSRLAGHARGRRRDLPLPGDEAMSELVTGQRVAVVGPAATEDQLGQMIDDYDVVVRTRHGARGEPGRIGTRTDIAYFAGRDLLKDYAEVSAVVDSGQLKLAVTRPFFISGMDTPPPWLRFARFEYGLYFRGAPLGIQRIVYDLLQFEPQEIGIFHADFYAGRQAAAAGYRSDYRGYGPESAMNDLISMHDLAYEFRCMRMFLTTGTVTAHGTSAEILSLSEPAYLQQLEEGPLGKRQSRR